MSVYKNMAFGLKLRKVPKQQIQQRVMEAAKILDIEHLLERKPKQLSGGQRQRVAVGRAIVREPAAFLFDEPLSNLDAKLRVTTRAELKKLHLRLKTTTIYVTHDQEEAMTLGDRIVVMKDGRIQQADTSLRTYQFPRNRFVAGFIGMPPMNFFDGVVKSEEGQLVFEEGKIEGAKSAAKVAAGGNGASDEPYVATGKVSLPGNGFKLPVPQHLRDILAGRVGQHIVLGIRPEHFHLKPVEGDSPAIRMQLNVIEPLGNDMDVYLATRLNDHVVGRVEATSGLAIGQEHDMYVDSRKVHFFEPGETGMNLSLTNEPAHANA
jgi:multiple sugar transport system ATP-binding protein